MDDWEEKVDEDDWEKNDELDAAYKKLIMLERSERIPFEDVEDIMTYIDKILAQKVSRADLAKRIKSRALLNFCIKSVQNKRKEQKEKQKLDRFLQSAGLETRVLLEIA